MNRYKEIKLTHIKKGFIFSGPENYYAKSLLYDGESKLFFLKDPMTNDRVILSIQDLKYLREAIDVFINEEKL